MCASCVELEGWRYISVGAVNDIMNSIGGHKTSEFSVYDGALSCCGLSIPCYALILPFWNARVYPLPLYAGSM